MSNQPIDRLKKDPRCVRLFQDRIKLKRESGEWVGLCPFHSEKSGSFHVYQESGGAFLGKCHGCGWCDSVVGFVAEFDKVPLRQAIETVKAVMGAVDNWERGKDIVESTFKTVAPASLKPAKTFALAEWSKAEAALAASKETQDWLLNTRGIGMETAKRLHLGYRQKLSISPDDKTYHLADKGWLAFPCVQDNKVVAIKYRSLVEKCFRKEGGMFSGDQTPWYNAEAIDPFESIFVTEGECDAIALEQAGFRAVSLQSASSPVTPAMRDQLKTASSVILAGDTDGGVGSAVMERLWRDLGDRCYLLKWEEVKDANQCFLETCGGDVDKFRETVESLSAKARAQPLPDIYSLPEVMMASNATSLKDHPHRLRFPWGCVDKMAILLPGSVLVVTATNTGQGKTQWVNEVCLHGSRKHSECVVNYQCELNEQEIAVITTANLLRKDRNHLQPDDTRQAGRLIRDIPYYVGSNPSLNTLDAVLDLLEAAVQRLGATVVVLDHIHFLTANSQNETVAQTNGMNRIKQMAQRYGVKFIVVAQPRKAKQENRGKRLHITDVKGGEALGSSADAVMFLHRDVVKDIDPASPPSDPYEAKTEIHLLKVRSKGEGAAMASLMFVGEFAAFQEIDFRFEEPAA